MKLGFGTALLLCSALSTGAAHSATLPAVKAGDKNQVPACTTPGRLMAYLKERNPALDSRFGTIASEYYRIGTELGMRWDYAFFQMIVETGSLSFKRDGRSGDVKPTQNNFAGLGATGKGERGESFPDVKTGVTAHLQHLLMYTGQKVDDAVADRTRKVQEWGVLTSWQKSIKGAVTFTDLTKKWAPGASSYGSDIEATGQRFYENNCTKPDPQPDLMAALNGKTAKPVAAKQDADVLEKVSGAELARKSIAEERAGSGKKKFALGAGNLAKAAIVETEAEQEEPPAAEAPAPKKSAASPAFKILNAPKADAPEQPAFVQASAGGLAKPALSPPAAAPSKCRVLTASYGGQRAIIIKSKSDQVVSYTVLEVNEGTEKRETDAYIQAYAKGGEQVGEFGTQTLALDKAFDLCPEG